MGIENRDYYRNQSGSGYRSVASTFPPVCKALLIANIVVFVLQLFLMRPATFSDVEARFRSRGVSEQELQELEANRDQLNELLDRIPPQSIVTNWFDLDPDKVARGQVWRLVTSAFCHDRGSIWHLLVNMLILFWMGPRLELMYGSREFGLFYFASAITASAAFLALAWYTGNLTPAIGASGAIFGLAVLYAFHFPYQKVYIYFLFPIEIRWLVLIYILFDLNPVIVQLGQPDYSDGVAHAAHLGGALFGFLYYRGRWRLDRWLDKTGISTIGGRGKLQKLRSQRPSLSVYHGDEDEPKQDPRDKHREAKLDEVLEKLHRSGVESLSDDELKFLQRASQDFRNRPR